MECSALQVSISIVLDFPTIITLFGERELCRLSSFHVANAGYVGYSSLFLAVLASNEICCFFSFSL